MDNVEIGIHEDTAYHILNGSKLYCTVMLKNITDGNCETDKIGESLVCEKHETQR